MRFEKQSRINRERVTREGKKLEEWCDNMETELLDFYKNQTDSEYV